MTLDTLAECRVTEFRTRLAMAETLTCCAVARQILHMVLAHPSPFTSSLRTLSCLTIGLPLHITDIVPRAPLMFTFQPASFLKLNHRKARLGVFHADGCAWERCAGVCRSCYPLHLHMFVTFKRDYGPHCAHSADDSAVRKEEDKDVVTAEQGLEAVKFWLWELTEFTEERVFVDVLALGPVRMHSVGPVRCWQKRHPVDP